MKIWIILLIVILLLLFCNIEWTYQVIEIPNLLTSEECQILIDAAEPRLSQSGLVSKDPKFIDTQVRSSKSAYLRDTDETLPVKTRQVLTKLRKAASKWSGKCLKCSESLHVAKYETGNEYKPHFDACANDPILCKSFNDRRKGGKRYATLLVYLNTVEDGGETEFPKLDKRVKPVQGTGVLFYNLTRDGKPHPLSLHAGLPPKENSVKWICTHWIREYDASFH